MARTFVPLNILTDAYTDGDTTYPAGTGGVVMSSGSGAPDPSKELSTYSWSELSAITGSADITKDQLSHFVGQTKTTTVSGFSGNWSVRCIGVDQDSADGRAHVLTFEFVDILFLDKIGYTSIWPEGTAFSTLNGNVYNGLPHNLMTAVQSVEKDYFDEKKNNAFTACKLWMYSKYELSSYEYWTIHSGQSDRVKRYNGSAAVWFTRKNHYTTVGSGGISSSTYDVVMTDGGFGAESYDSSYGIVPCFCI